MKNYFSLTMCVSVVMILMIGCDEDLCNFGKGICGGIGSDGDTDGDSDGDTDTDTDSDTDGDTDTDTDQPECVSYYDESEAGNDVNGGMGKWPSYPYAEFFECPPENVELCEVETYTQGDLMEVNNLIWEEVASWLDDSCVAPCEENSANCVEADCVTDEGAHIEYVKENWLDDFFDEEWEMLTVTLPDGLETWQTCTVERLQYGIDSERQGSTYTASARCVGKINEEWPADISIKSESSEYITSEEERWTSRSRRSWFSNGVCKISRKDGSPVTVRISYGDDV